VGTSHTISSSEHTLTYYERRVLFFHLVRTSLKCFTYTLVRHSYYSNPVMVSGSTHNSRAGSFAHRPFTVTNRVRAAGAARLQPFIIAIDGSYSPDCVTAVCGTFSSCYVNRFCGQSQTQGHIGRTGETRGFCLSHSPI